MKDKELYEVLLGLKKPWEVEEVKEKKVEVVVGYEKRTIWGDEEGRRLPTHDHVERRWRHLDSCGFETVILKTRMEQSPYSEVAATQQIPIAPRWTRWVTSTSGVKCCI